MTKWNDTEFLRCLDIKADIETSQNEHVDEQC